MLEILSSLNWIAVAVAAMVYYLLGGLWYAPRVFGRRWEAASGFQRSPGWRPGLSMYVGPLVGCFAATLATAILVRAADVQSLGEALVLGAVIGLGYGAAISGTDAMAPTNARPMAVFAVAGTYHAVGLVLVALLVTVWG